MKLLLATVLALLALTASAQVTFTTNSGGMSLVLYVTNMASAERQLLEQTWRIRNNAVTTNTSSRTYLPAYLYTTNYVESGTDTNGQPVFSQVVTTNAVLSRQAFLTLIADPRNLRTVANTREIIQEWCVNEQRKIGAMRNEQE
jgi:hypothetical protein